MAETVQIKAEPLPHREVQVDGSGLWGPDRALVTRLRKLGYTVEEHHVMATGDVWLEVSGQQEAPGI